MKIRYTRRELDSCVNEVVASLPVTGNQLQVVNGYEQCHIPQIIAKSCEPHILHNTPRDAAERFTDLVKFLLWAAGDKAIYLLEEVPSRDLAGLQWFRPAPLPLPESYCSSPAPRHTTALRLYDSYLGKGLAEPFMTQAHCHYTGALLQTGTEFTGFWLQTNESNTAARRTYTALGYEELTALDGRVTASLSLAKAIELYKAHA